MEVTATAILALPVYSKRWNWINANFNKYLSKLICLGSRRSTSSLRSSHFKAIYKKSYLSLLSLLDLFPYIPFIPLQHNGFHTSPIVEPYLKHTSFNVPKATYPAVSTTSLPSCPTTIELVTIQSIDSLNAILRSKSYTELQKVLLAESCYWKDHLGLATPKFVTISGSDEIVDFMNKKCGKEGECVGEKKEPQVSNLDPEGKIKWIQAFIVFETMHARGKGLITLLRDVTDGDKYKMFILFTTLHSLKECP